MSPLCTLFCKSPTPISAGNVIFYNRFVNLEELIEFISAADIYITPYLSPAQITSGTLAYTLGAGKAIISTPYWYAEEMLADERARAERRSFMPTGFVVKPLEQRPGELPPVKLDHLHRMTDDTGMIQHVNFYEAELSYCNAVLPQAMLMCGQWIPNKAMTEAGLDSLCWLAEQQRADTAEGHFVPIGSNGFYARNGEKARFDQQPIEAQMMASACLEAYLSTGDKRWRTEARRPFEWFLGRNDLNLSLYDPATGAAVTASIPTVLMRIKVRNLRWLFCKLYWNCVWLRTPYYLWKPRQNESTISRTVSPP